MKNFNKMSYLSKHKTFLVVSCLVFHAMTLEAQELLTKKQAIETAMVNNFNIKIAAADVQIAKNNSTKKNTGYLPSITGRGGGSYAVNTLVRPDSTGENVSTSGIVNQNYNASLNVDYTIFDGMNRFNLFNQLKTQHQLSELQAREVIENTIISIFNNYYLVARLTQDLQNMNRALTISKKRMLRVSYSYEYGQNTQLDVLNAEVDINTDSINYINGIQQLDNAKRDLNLLLGRDVETRFQVDTVVNFINDINFSKLESDANQNNVRLLLADKGLSVGEHGLKVSRSAYNPTIALNGSYGWNKSKNATNPFFGNQATYGPSASATVNWNIFNGGKTDVNVQNAKLNVLKQKMTYNQVKEQLKRDLSNHWSSYQNALFTLYAQTKNLETNQRNFQRSEEQYKVGQITSVQFRQAQLNLVQTKTSYNQAKYNAKLAELNLLQLSGQLLNTSY